MSRSIMTACLLLSVALPARAQTTQTQGLVIQVFADPSDVVVVLDKVGRCGSAYFHIQRSSDNFKEAVAIALTAFSTGKQLAMWVASCAADRNITSGDFVNR